MKKYYLIYRRYNYGEKVAYNYAGTEMIVHEQHSVYYGWTTSKQMLRAFFKQRNHKKYTVDKIYEDELEDRSLGFEDDDKLTKDYQLDYTILQSREYNEKIYLICTSRELCEAEIQVQQKFSDMASLKYISGPSVLLYLNMLLAIDPYYLDALFYIGYRPEEIDIQYDSVTDYDNFNDLGLVEDQITSVYEYHNIYDSYPSIHEGPIGTKNVSSPFHQIIYSFESFISVMKSDM